MPENGTKSRPLVPRAGKQEAMPATLGMEMACQFPESGNTMTWREQPRWWI
jgi:hypothetical protein